MAKMVNFRLCVFYHNKERKEKEKKKTHNWISGSWRMTLRWSTQGTRWIVATLRDMGIWWSVELILEKAMAPHSSTLACKIPWVEAAGRLQSMGSRIVRHDWATSLSFFPYGYLGYKSLILHYRGAPSSKAHGGFQKLSAVHLQVFPLWESPRWKNSDLQSSLLRYAP